MSPEPMTARTGISVSFDDIRRLGARLADLTTECGQVAADAARIGLDHNFLGSWALSPLTGVAAASSLTAVVRQVGDTGRLSQLLHAGVGAAESAYAELDDVLGSAARALTGTFADRSDDLARDLGPLSRALSAGTHLITRATSAQIAIRSITAKLAPFAAAGAIATYYQNMGQTYRSVLSNPFSPQSYSNAREAWKDVGQEFAKNTLTATGAMPDPLYAQTLRELPFLLRSSGISDRARLVDTSVVSPEELEERGRNYSVTNPRATAQTVTHPTTPADLADTMGYIDSLGLRDQAVIRVLRKAGPPPAFTVVIPSTKDWSLAAEVPNDVTGNLNIMTGDSALLRASNEALERAMAAAGVKDPTTTKVMVAGFSQGGITAAAFATAYQHDYDVAQVVTIGAPIGRFRDIPARTHVLAYEFGDDLVPQVDHAKNPSTTGWETIRVPGGKHSAALYGEAARTHPPRKNHRLEEFLSSGDDVSVTDYYAIREHGK